MSAATVLLAALVFAPRLWSEEPGRSTAPSYSTDSIVNSASNRVGPLAPHTLATIYGSNLAYAVRLLQPDDLVGGKLPSELGGVRVSVNGILAPLLYASPQQVNFVVPAIKNGEATLRIIRDGTGGPSVRFNISDTSPAFFQLDPETIIATHADGSLVNKDSPAQPDEIIVLYATGLGLTSPRQADGQLAATPAELLQKPQLLLNDEPLPLDRIIYAGITPGFAGLYQINVHLPEHLPENPEIRVIAAEHSSPPGLHIDTQKQLPSGP